MPHWPEEGWFAELRERLGETTEDQEALLLILELSCTGEGEPLILSCECVEVVRDLEEFPHPVIGVVDGPCLDCCLEVAAACDLLFATEHSSFGLPSGILPGLGGTQRLVRMVGMARAKELYLAGRIWSALQACQYGLLNGTASGKELEGMVKGFVDTLLTRSPKALSFCKEVVHRGYDLDLRNGCEFERQVFSLCFTTYDQKEGMTAFAEKRKPRFEGLE